MNEEELTQMADFLSIALEEMEYQNYDSAKDFVEYVSETIQSEADLK